MHLPLLYLLNFVGQGRVTIVFYTSFQRHCAALRHNCSFLPICPLLLIKMKRQKLFANLLFYVYVVIPLKSILQSIL